VSCPAPEIPIMADVDSLERDVAALFEELRVPLRRYLVCAGLSGADADEGVQEAFLRLHRHLGNRGDRSNLRGWIFQVARNMARNEFKSARRRVTETLTSVEFADPRGTPEDAVIGQERDRRLGAAIGKLSPQQRECVLLRAAGLRYREIAGVLGIGISSVGELVQRATARLSEELS
jgi:RNA polymerase sigma-70 factor, ECF subfamily